MDDDRQLIWGRALVDAKRFLSRWTDNFTLQVREDLAQDAACAAICRLNAQRNPLSFSALVRTITRRLRMKALMKAASAAAVGDGDSASWPAPDLVQESCVKVDGEPIALSWLLERLSRVMPTLPPTNQRLLLGFYGGATCRQLSMQFGLSEDAIKVRLHRCRGLLRRRLEAHARAAGIFEDDV